jgi:DNA gyrase subunit A
MMSERIIARNIVDQYKNDMIRYIIVANRRRSVPDRKDGLKLVHRRIIDAMYFNEGCSNHNVKSSAVVGTVMKKSHPHGDVAIYNSMKPMANWFEIYMPLIDADGNFGNVQGDGQAAPRYTEVRLSKFALDCVISELKETKEVVDWVDTYDYRTLEPEFLPVSVPLLLINGAYGIGVGLITEIPKHNINEVIDATIQLIRDPESQIELIPDNCMPCHIINTNFKAIGNKGHGKYRVRGIIDIEEFQGKPALIIKSIPDLVYLNSVEEKLHELITSNKLPQIVDMVDDTRDEILKKTKMCRFIIILKKGSDANYVREVIYKNTLMEKSCNVNFEVMDGIEPLRMSYKSYLLSFIEFRKITKFRLYCNKLQKAQTNLHELEAYIKVFESGELDNVLNMMKNQKTIDDSATIEYLINKLGVTDLQAKFIANGRRQELSWGYYNKYKNDVSKYSAQVEDYFNRITHDELLVEEIVNELILYKQKYGKPRNCKIVKMADESDIPKGEFKIVITENNFIKKISLNEFVGNSKGDSPKHVLKVDNTENILLLDDKGKVFKLPIHKVPFTDKSSNGIDIRILIKNLTANINTVLYEPTLSELSNKSVKYFVTIITREGYIKKLDIEDFMSVPPSGILYTKLNNGDIVKDIAIVANNLDIIVYSDYKALRMNMSDIPHYKRNTLGVNAMATNDKIDGLSIIYPGTTDIIVITESGKINKFDVVALPISERYKSGSSVIKLSKGDSIHSIHGVNNNTILKILTKNEKIEIPIEEIPSASSISSGTKMISLKSDNIIKSEVYRKK